jgi:D-3-phosphoglycerate dehydrogenase
MFDAPNLLLTPHVAGITATSWLGMSRGAVHTMLALLRSERPANVVNPQVFHTDPSTRQS